LVQFQHLLQRREVMRPGLAEFEDHGRSIQRPTVEIHRRKASGGMTS
jgi:hypothetical protein